MAAIDCRTRLIGTVSPARPIATQLSLWIKMQKQRAKKKYYEVYVKLNKLNRKVMAEKGVGVRGQIKESD